MIKGYKNLINAFALQSMPKKVQFPDYHCMVGESENLQSLPIIIWKDYIPASEAVRIPDVEEMSYEDIQENLASGKLTINDFFQNIYPLGNPLM